MTFILSDEEAEILKTLEEAACEHGIVMDLLSSIEHWQQTGMPDTNDMRFFELAAMAATLARIERKKRRLE